jgi:hypothetical protein
MHKVNNLKTQKPEVTKNVVTDSGNYSSFLRDNCLVKSRNESNAPDGKSLNKQPTERSSRIVGHKQA